MPEEAIDIVSEIWNPQDGRATAISAGDGFTCVATTSGVFCRGQNTDGQIGRQPNMVNADWNEIQVEE